MNIMLKNINVKFYSIQYSFDNTYMMITYNDILKKEANPSNIDLYDHDENYSYQK